ncbi:unnamed protein product [Callosobruchus maculatus]|uniref:Crossover junction endonuclease MUS81 n=1 Tax=Callosobruchus maculatus TaxID=64391 RepID=A0A653BR44_CALMS|nr:unnamed protein product [Callosobruchus maculatus]
MSGRRVTMKLKTPNYLFQTWLTEWRDEAKRSDSLLVSSYEEALQSLKMYPLPLKSGKECKILIGFTTEICSMLDKKLESFKLLNEPLGTNIQKESGETPCSSDINKAVNLPNTDQIDILREINTIEYVPKDKKKKPKTILHSKSEEIQSTQKNKPKSTSRPQKMAKHASSNAIPSVQEEDFVFSPGGFDIILYVDTQEVEGKNTTDPMLEELDHLGIKYEVKSLKIGDYIWICRERTSNKELVLPYIIERKRLDDFSGSIKDGRYHEQKFRLKKSGIKNVYYLIEDYNKKKHIGLPLSTLRQAAVNTAIQDGFYVKETKNWMHTARFLAQFTAVLLNTFKDKTIFRAAKESIQDDPANDLISLMSFNEFNQSSSKNKAMTVSDMFTKMLIQINGMSVDKATAIVECFPTPALLQDTLQKCSQNEGEQLIADIRYSKLQKKIGPTLAKILYQLFTSNSFP